MKYPIMKPIIVLFIFSLIYLSACGTVKYVPKPYPVEKTIYIPLPAELFSGCDMVSPLSAGSTNGELLQKYFDLLAMNKACVDSLKSIRELSNHQNQEKP